MGILDNIANNITPQLLEFWVSHPIKNDILIQDESLARSTGSGWRFAAGKVLSGGLSFWQATSASKRAIDIITTGWRPNMSKELSPVWFNSNTMSTEEDKAWTDEVYALWAMGAISPVTEEWVTKWGFPQVVVPIFVVFEGTKWRPITDARFPNLGWTPPWFHLGGIQAFCALVTKGAYLFKADMKSGWQHVPIHPVHASLMAFQWKEHLFVFNVLAFGDSTAPEVFTYLTVPMRRVLSSHGIRSDMYIDDL